jgi:hypothetical protein
MQGNSASAVRTNADPCLWLVLPSWLEGPFPTMRIRLAHPIIEPRPKPKLFQLQVSRKSGHTFVTSYPCWLCRLLARARVLPVQPTERALADTSPVTGLLISLQGMSLVYGVTLKTPAQMITRVAKRGMGGPEPDCRKVVVRLIATWPAAIS